MIRIDEANPDFRANGNPRQITRARLTQLGCAVALALTTMVSGQAFGADDAPADPRL